MLPSAEGVHLLVKSRSAVTITLARRFFSILSFFYRFRNCTALVCLRGECFASSSTRWQPFVMLSTRSSHKALFFFSLLGFQQLAEFRAPTSPDCPLTRSTLLASFIFLDPSSSPPRSLSVPLGNTYSLPHLVSI